MHTHRYQPGRDCHDTYCAAHICALAREPHRHDCSDLGACGMGESGPVLQERIASQPVLQALTIVTQTFGILAALHGLGNHLNVVIEAGEGHSFLKSAWLTMFFFLIAIATGKAAVAVFLMEIIGRACRSAHCETSVPKSIRQLNQARIDPTIRKTLIAVAALNFLVAVPVAIYSQLQCNPPGALWDPARQQLCHRKINTALSYLAGAVAGFSDLLLALLPIFVLWSLRIDRKLKIGLCCLLGIGVFAAGAATVRTWACSFILSEDSSCKFKLLRLNLETGVFRRFAEDFHDADIPSGPPSNAVPMGRDRGMGRHHPDVHPPYLASVQAVSPALLPFYHIQQRLKVG